jgi:hypothetical protein
MIHAIARLRGRVTAITVFVCLFCTLPYWRATTLPAISDTYLQVWLGRKYLHFSTWPELAADALYRCRATSIWLTGLVDSLFGSEPLILKTQSILIHSLNVGLVASLGRFSFIGYRLSIPAALFWGFNERHHEAVMWYAALPEQLVFTFVILTFRFWLRWWESGSAASYTASVACYLLALLSKESAVVACPLLALTLVFEPKRWRSALLPFSPFLLLSVLYFVANMAARDNHLHWNDGTFKIGWHFIPVVFNSTARLISLWGLLALAVLYYFRRMVNLRLAFAALLWIPIALGPYAFVAYQPRVPSRHVYLASLGVAFILALSVQPLLERRRLLAAVFVAYGCFNTGYIWFFKHQQFVDRANVTEFLIRDASSHIGEHGVSPLRVSCFPLAPEIAVISLNDRLSIPEELIQVNYSTDPACGPVKIEPLRD